MKKLFCFFFLFIFLFSSCGCFSKTRVPDTGLTDYDNKKLSVSLKYPSSWKPDSSVAKLGSLPSRYFSDEGFFALNVIAKNGLDLDEIATKEASSGEYGNNPSVERIIHNARIGYLILPSSDQPSSEELRSCFITDLRTIFRSNRASFDVILLFSDKDHIQNILDSMEIN